MYECKVANLHEAKEQIETALVLLQG